MQFSVRTLAPDLSISSVVIDAVDAQDARSQVEARGLFVSAVEPAAGGRVVRMFRERLSLVQFSQELLALLSAGLGVVEGLEALLEKESNLASRTVIERLLAGLREGRRFSSVLAAQPALFPPLYVGIVRAAESTSDLPRALARYIDYRQRIDAVRGRIISASIYPLILLCVGGAVSVFLIAYVVPRFAEVYQGAGRSLPWLSQVMLYWGQFAASHGIALAFGSLGGMVLVVLGVRRMVHRYGLAELLARVPGLGKRVQVVELSRLYLTLGMLIEGGITIRDAINTVGTLVSPGVTMALAGARGAIEAGRPLSDAFEEHHLVTPISLRMLRVGERTGEMGRMLTESAVFYDGEIGRWIDRFTRTFEPLLMAAIGLVVGAIVVLLYMPIFDLAGDIS